jgi:hypothetical protein
MAAHIYYNGFDVVRVDEHGIVVPMPGETVTITDLSGGGFGGSTSTDAEGKVDQADATDTLGATGDDVILEFSVSPYPGTIRRKLVSGSVGDAALDPYNCNVTLVAEDLTTSDIPANLNEVWVHNETYPDLPDQFVGLAATDAVTALDWAAPNAGVYTVYTNPVLENGERRHLRYQDGPSSSFTAGASGFGVESVSLSMPSIFSVSGSPGTANVSLGVTLATEAANKVFAGPTSGGAATPTFRSLVAADIPSLSSIYQPLDATLTALAAANWAANDLPIGTGADTLSQTSFAANTFPARASTGNLVAKSISDVALTLLAQTTQANMRSTGLGLGDMATQNANGVAITGGSLSSSSLLISSGVQIQTSTLLSNSLGGTAAGGNANLFANQSLCVLDATSGTWALTIKPGSTFTANRTLTINTGDSDRSLTLSANATISNTNSGDVTLAGQNYLSIASQVITANAVDLSGTHVTGTLAAARFPALTGDVTNSAGSLATAIGTNKVLDTMIRQSAGLSLIGRSANTTGNVADITAASDGQVMRRSGTAISFGAVDLASANSITNRLPFANLTQGSARSVLGVTGNSTADFASIQGTTNQVLRVDSAGTGLSFGAINLASSAAVSGITPIANGGTNASSFGTTSGMVTYDGTRLVSSPNVVGIGAGLEVLALNNAGFYAYANHSTSAQFTLGNQSGTNHWAIYETLGAAGQQGSFKILDYVAVADVWTIDTTGSITNKDGGNYVLGTTTGTKFATGTTQKLSFWNATPIVQPTTGGAAATFVANSGTAVNDASTFDGYTLKQVVKALRNAGLLA